MTTTRYLGTEITRTQSVCLSRNNKRLHALFGEVEKAAEIRPFITSIREAREYISGVMDNRAAS